LFVFFDSDPAAEEAETELKASALVDAIVRGDSTDSPASDDHLGGDEGAAFVASDDIRPRRVLLVDHEDSFVHTLANYLRQTGAEVVTCRSGASLATFIEQQIDSNQFKPDIVVLSPGPGSPSDFHLSQTIAAMIQRRVPIFGVCLGLQGLVEYFGGQLGVLGYPMHGKPSIITRSNTDISDDVGQSGSESGSQAPPSPLVYGGIETDVLQGLPQQFQVARYHSLHGKRDTLPADLLVTATSSDGTVMAIQHAKMPIAAVQFHPESILTLPKNGMRILTNALDILKSEHYPE
jgi:anthranilate synthase